MEYVLEFIWHKHLFCRCVEVRKMESNPGGFFKFQFYVYKAFLYQKNLEALFERSNGEGLKKIVNGLVAQTCKN